MKRKKRGVISFSGGETSAYMLQWLLKNKSDVYDFVVLFANTGRESNETLLFVEECAKLFNVKIVWLEALFEPYVYKTVHSFDKSFDLWKERSVDDGDKHEVVDFITATRNQDWKTRDNTPFEEMVKWYGLANIKSKFSTRELKQRPMDSYLRSIGWAKGTYDTFIGIRNDEIDRISSSRKKLRLKYPLIEWVKFTKKHVNFWWSQQAFRLLLKGWEGNCVTCYKKGLVKLTKIMVDDPWKFDFDRYLEWKYEYYIPERRIKKLVSELKPMPELPIKLFRESNSVSDIERRAENFNKVVVDDSQETAYQTELFQESESCDVFTECGS